VPVIDGRVIADPFQPSAVMTPLLDLLYSAFRASTRRRSLPERTGQALASLRTRVSEA
jgi:hypothetical protein